MNPSNPEPPDTTLPWWRHRMMWLVVGGPTVVVIAAVATAVIAIRGADELVDEPKSARVAPGDPHAPALKARNHAVTPTER